LKHSNVM